MDQETFWGLTTTGWTAVTSLLTGGLLVVALLAALYAKRQVKIARDQAEEARRAEAEASRPYVIVTVEPSPTGPPSFDLVVKNIGQRPAFKVQVRLEPAPVRASEPEGHELAQVKMLNHPVEMIAPDQELRTFYDSHVDRNGRADLPSLHVVRLSYLDSSGHIYEETSAMDLNALEGTLYASVKTIHHIGKSLYEIEKRLKSASILGRHGAVEVEASVESRAEKDERRSQAATESAKRHNELIRQLLPRDKERADPDAEAEGSNGGSASG